MANSSTPQVRKDYTLVILLILGLIGALLIMGARIFCGYKGYSVTWFDDDWGLYVWLLFVAMFFLPLSGYRSE